MDKDRKKAGELISAEIEKASENKLPSKLISWILGMFLGQETGKGFNPKTINNELY